MARRTQIEYMAMVMTEWVTTYQDGGYNIATPITIVSTWHDWYNDSKARLLQNVQELCEAHILVVDTFAESTGGGYHYETGMADLMGIKIYTVGPRIKYGYLSLYPNFEMYRDLHDYLFKGSR